MRVVAVGPKCTHDVGPGWAAARIRAAPKALYTRVVEEGELGW